MFSISHLKLWALPVSILQVSALTVTFTGAISASKTSPAAAQNFTCISAGQSPVPSSLRNRATAALNAYGIRGLTEFTFTRDSEFFEVQANTGGDNSKDVEVDIVNDAQDNKIEEVEQLVTLGSAPAAVKRTFNDLVPLNRRQVLCVERSISPQPGPRPVPPASPSTVKYEIAYRCTSPVRYPASAPRDGVDRDCRTGEVNEVEITSQGEIIRIKTFS